MAMIAGPSRCGDNRRYRSCFVVNGNGTTLQPLTASSDTVHPSRRALRWPPESAPSTRGKIKPSISGDNLYVDKVNGNQKCRARQRERMRAYRAKAISS